MRRAPGLDVRGQAVLGDGRFEMGHVIAGNGRDDLPVSRLAADVARAASGGPLGELLPGVDQRPAGLIL